MKVICAGAPKTGTKSLAKALRILGYNQVFDFEEAVEFAFDQWEEVFKGHQPNLDRVLDEVYSKNVEAVVDTPHSYFFDKFLERWPKAKVVLMVREENAWFQSYKNMVEEGAKTYSHMIYLKHLSRSLTRLLDWSTALFSYTVGSASEPKAFLWKTWYRRHNAYVKAIVPKEQLLVYDVRSGWKPLCDFLQKEVPDDDFPFENRASGIKKDKVMHRVMTDLPIVKKAEGEIKQAIAVLGFFLISVFIACFALLV